MRILFEIHMDTRAANKSAQDGEMGNTLNRILEESQPESIYFSESEGDRTAFMVANIENSHEIPAYCEPWFQAFDADIRMHPAMTPEDLSKAQSAIDKSSKNYGRKK